MASETNSGPPLQAPRAVVEEIDAGWEDLLEFASSRAGPGEVANAASSTLPPPALPSSLPPMVSEPRSRSSSGLGDADLRFWRGRVPAAVVAGATALLSVVVITSRTREGRRERAPATIQQPAAAVPAAPHVDALAGTSREKPIATLTVTIKTIPPGAVIFRGGKRIGTSGTEVSVAPDDRIRLTALLNGYAPSVFTVDGSRSAVTIVMKRAPKLPDEPMPTNNVPIAAPSAATDVVTPSTTSGSAGSEIAPASSADPESL